MAGRKRKLKSQVIADGDLEKNGKPEFERRMSQGIDAVGSLRKPYRLPKAASTWWDRIVKQMSEIPGLLGVTDQTVLLDFCRLRADMDELRKQFEKEPAKIINGNGAESINPLRTEWGKLHDRSLKLMVQLGLTPSARLHMDLKLEQDSGNAKDDFFKPRIAI